MIGFDASAAKFLVTVTTVTTIRTDQGIEARVAVR
jgi:hypothetical protein